MFEHHKKESPVFTGITRGVGGFGFGKASAAAAASPVAGALSLSDFPNAYQTLISSSASAGYTMIYVDSEFGNDANSGNSITAPKRTFYSLFNVDGTSGLAANSCIVIKGFHYIDWNSGTSQLGVIDNGTSYFRVIAAPGQTLLRARNSGAGRDHHISAGDSTTRSDIYGAILEKVRDTARTTNYMTAFHAPNSRGRFYNCVFRSVNASSKIAQNPIQNVGARDQTNDLFTMHYDNGDAIVSDSYYCVHLGTWNGGNYTGGSNCNNYNCTGNDASTTTSGANSTNTYGQTINGNFSVGVADRGVYNGTYAWNSSKFNTRFSYANPYE